jgi:hypothetical protein
MNAPVRPPAAARDDLADAREETYRLLQSVAHYCKCCHMHLAYSDDPVALIDFRTAREYFIAAIREFEPIHAAMRNAGAATEGGA